MKQNRSFCIEGGEKVVRKPMSELRDYLEFDETTLSLWMYKIMKARGEWFYPGWDAPCTFVALIHAYELLHIECMGEIESKLPSLLSLFSKNDLAAFGSGMKLAEIDTVANKLNISFAVYYGNESYCVGKGTWMENFFIYNIPGHAIPVSQFTVKNGTRFISRRLGVKLLL
jgi:hypothetical protein